jgi:hypothetical protein
LRTLLATIDHSCTKYALRILGWRDDGSGRQVLPVSECSRKPSVDLLFAHLEDAEMPAILELIKSGVYLVTTARDPVDIRASWISRGKSLDALAIQVKNLARLLEFNPTIIVPGHRE